MGPLDTVWTVQCIVRFIAIIIVIIALIYILVQHHHRQSMQVIDLEKPQKFQLLATIIAYCAFIICLASHLINLLLLLHGGDSETTYGILENVYILSWNAGHIVIFIIFMQRLHSTLNSPLNDNPGLRLSKMIYIIFTICIVIYVLNCVMIGIYTTVFVRKLTVTLSWHQQYFLNLEYYVGAEIMDSVLTFFLLFLFVRKLWQIMRAMHRNINDKHKSLILCEQQHSLSSILSKYLLLYGVVVIANQAVTAILTLRWISKLTTPSDAVLRDENVSIFQNVFHFATPFVLVVNTICLLLLFENMDTLFVRCCLRCHLCLRMAFYRCGKGCGSKRKDYKLTDKELQSVLLESV